MFFWKWKLFWGNCYKIYDRNNHLVKRILIWRKENEKENFNYFSK